MIANVVKMLLALGLFSFISNENVQANKWDNDHDESINVRSRPAYVRVAYSPSNENSQDEKLLLEASSVPAHYVASEEGKFRVLRTKISHRSGSLFVKPLRHAAPSIHSDRNGESLFQEDLQKNNSERQEDEASLEIVSYTSQLLGQEDPDSLVSYIQ